MIALANHKTAVISVQTLGDFVVNIHQKLWIGQVPTVYAAVNKHFMPYIVAARHVNVEGKPSVSIVCTAPLSAKILHSRQLGQSVVRFVITRQVFDVGNCCLRNYCSVVKFAQQLLCALEQIVHFTIVPLY